MKNKIYKNEKEKGKKMFSLKIKTLFVCSILLFSIAPINAHAQIPFGGNILWASECACSGGILLFIFNQATKTPLPIVFQFGVSRLNQNYNIFTPGVETLGSFTPGGVCLMGKTACTPFPVVGTVTPRPLPGIGTSLIPSL